MTSNHSVSTEDLVGSNKSPAAVEEAQTVVEDIAALNGVFSPALLKRAEGPNGDKDIKRLVASNSNLKSIASNATHRLAEDLNDAPTHFVLECIQNADDNDYAAGVKPFLRLSVSPQRIQLDCNEKGFKEKHVRALCSVGQSTKSEQKATEEHVGYIGEKGIGFKSVFKVAEQVYVHSPPFSFMFGKRRELGMMTLFWVPEEEVRSTLRDDSQTAILLLPNARETYAKILTEFVSIPSTLLLFLRKLKMLELLIINLPPGAGPTSIHKTLTSKMLESGRVAILTERDVVIPNKPKIVKEEKYHIFEQVRQITPDIEEERRKGVKKTELALAFPVNVFGEPCTSTQLVHAFLPIGDYGFRFLIQADFIVTSSRQDVEGGSSWNKALRSYVAHVFKDAIVDFVSSSNHGLRYTWMRFLPTDVPHLFWNPIKDSIQQVIRSSKVLESRAGTLHCPPDLRRLPTQMEDRSRCPIVGDDSSYLSSNYKDQDILLLKDLGLEICSWHWFLQQLYFLGDTVKSKPVCWHEDLAKSLHSIGETSDWAFLGLFVKQLPLIPLQDGTWVSATQVISNPIYFRRDNGMVDVPADINLRLVDSGSSANTDREQFYRLLGVKDCDKNEVAHLILRKHQDGNSIPQMGDAVAHVRYLFALDPTICEKLDLGNLWFYDEQGKAARGHDLYVRPATLERYSAGILFGSEFPARFLSANYGSCTEVNGQRTIPLLIQFLLERSTGITEIPRLTKSGRLSQEFEFILKKFPNDVLHILKEHWATYKYYVGNMQTVRNRISSCEVRTFDGVNFKRQKLKDTFAPDPILKQASSDLCSESQGVFFLYFDFYKPSDWEFLKAFGVKSTADLVFYEWLVEQPQFRDLCTLPKFKDLIWRMARLARVDSIPQSAIRKIFAKNNVFIPKTIGGDWARSTHCVWGAPSGFQNQRSIKQWYNDNNDVTTLLQSTLRIQDATAEAVIGDLTSITPSDEYLKTASAYLVAKLTKFPGADALKTVREAFKNHAFLPVGGAVPIRVKSTSCFWGNPDFKGPRLSFKHNLQREYQDDATMSTLCRSILGLLGPTWHDLIREIEVLKGRDVVAEYIEDIYAYMFQNFHLEKENWKKMLAIFESQALVFVQSSSGNCWKRPSECIWQTPITLRCKFALKEQYNSSNFAVPNLLQRIMCIKDASVTEYISDLEILSTTGSCSRDDVETLYKHIELQWKPEMDIRSAFGSKRLIWNHKETKWISLDDCVWYGPDCIELTTKFVSLYPESKKLFSEYLGVRNATSTTFTRELSGLHISDPENISADNLERVKALLFGLDRLIVERPGEKFPQTVEKFLKSQRVWPRKYIGSAPVVLVDLTQPFFVPDHTLLIKLLQTKEDCDFPILDVQFEEVSKVKRLLLDLGLDGRSLSLSKKETVSATDMSDPADDLTEDLRKRAQALFYCAVHFETTRKLEVDDLLKKLSNICVYRTPDISTKYEVDSQGIEKSVMAIGYLRMAEEFGELRVFVPDNESLQRTGYSNCLAIEMIGILQIPEDRSWQAVNALLISKPDVEQLALILSIHGIHHKLNQPSVSVQGETDETVPSEPFYEDKCAARDSVAADLPANIEGNPLSAALNCPFNQSLVHKEEFGQVQSREQCRGSSRGSTDDTEPLDMDALQAPLPPDMFAFRASHKPSRRSLDNLAATKSRIAEARASTTSTFTVAARPTSAFDLSNLAMALPPTPPRTPGRNRSVEIVRSTQSGSPPARSTPVTPPSRRSGSSTAPRTNRHRYGDIDIIGYDGEQFAVETLKQHLSDFQEATHWTSKLRTSAGFGIYATKEVTDLTYPDTMGLLSKFIIDSMEEGSVPDWLAATRVPGSKCPTYFLEVKTTTGACGKPLFISSKQFGIMEEKAINGPGIPKEVYVILRVYNMYDGPQIKIYLDPWNKKDQQGGLRFTVAYSGTPFRIGAV